MHYDVAVIGGGPGGYVAAIRAAQLGAKVLLAEKDQLGGVCLNRGCIPTKTLLASADKLHEMKRCAEFGLSAGEVGFDYEKVTAHMNDVVLRMRSGVQQLLKSNGIEVKKGIACLTGPKQLAISTAAGTEEYTANAVILATGSSPVGLPVPGGELAAVISSDQLLALTEVPKRMVVVGAGAVGIEFAAIFQAFGCDVTVVEMMPAILPNVDGEMVKRMTILLRKQGLKLLPGRRVSTIEAAPDGGVFVTVTDGETTEVLAADKVLSSIGRAPNVAAIGLEAAGVDYSCKGVVVNEHLETNVPGIYAIGDVTGCFMWAHAASAAGMVAAENACWGARKAGDYRAVPGCIYTTPEMAMTGLTEEAALAAGKQIKVSKFNVAANGKALSTGEPDGLVKIIADAQTGAVLGMHILSAHASDLIMEGALAIQNGLTAKALAGTIHPHPSLSEVVMECAHGIDGAIIHQVRSALSLRK